MRSSHTWPNTVNDEHLLPAIRLRNRGLVEMPWGFIDVSRAEMLIKCEEHGFLHMIDIPDLMHAIREICARDRVMKKWIWGGWTDRVPVRESSNFFAFSDVTDAVFVKLIL